MRLAMMMTIGVLASSTHAQPGWVLAQQKISDTAMAYADFGDQLAKLLPTDGAANDAFGGSILFVDDDAALGGDGAGWDTAYRFLQDALAYAFSPKNEVLEIRVGQGIYLPDRDENNPNGNGDRYATFKLISGVALMGGYAGLGADDPDARDVDLYETILSGDLAGDDGPDFLNNGENTLHIVTSTYTVEPPALSGFTITGANTNLWGNNIDDRGGGLFLSHTTVAVEQCRFLANAANNNAAGVWSRQSDSSFVNCIFQDNIVSPGASGAAIHNVFGSTVTLVNCLFQDNGLIGVSTGGGVMFIGGNMLGNQAAFLVAESCIFVGNNGSAGGAILNNGFAEFHNCLFVANQAFGDGYGKKSGHGGAIANFGELTITNSTFVANSAVLEGGAIYAGNKTANTNLDSILSLTNCILWGNTGSGNLQDQQIGVADPDVFVNYSCIAGLTGSLGGDGNVGSDPQFVDPNGRDGIPGNIDDNLRLGPGSSCIDAADNTAVPKGIDTDLDGNPRFHDDTATTDTGNGSPPIVDMGAYEFQDTTNGACCFDDGMCSVETESDCISFGGTYQGHGTGCTPNPCPQPTGACCIVNDLCVEVTLDQCDVLGGTYLGDDTPCTQDSCLPVFGACCLADGSCFVLELDACNLAGGTYQGDDTDCRPNPCLLPCPWDLDGSGSVGATDLLSLLVTWGPCDDCDDCPADFDDNCTVGATDLLAMLVNWGPCP